MTTLLDLAISVALEAGALAAKRRSEGVEVAATKSTIVDIVTEADREVERLVIDRLSKARPHDGMLGEEGASVTGTSGLTWVVDPIDGTVNYLYDIPHYAVSIGLVEGDPDPLTWVAKVGVVINPASGEIFTAEAGQGAYAGTRRLKVADAVPLEQALVATGFAYAASTRAFQGDVVARLLPQVRDIRRLGTASLDLCFVADGRYNAYFERTLSPWDHAAGALIAREAGARVIGMRGAAPSRELILAAHPEVAARLEALLDELGEFEDF
ncbi:MAG: inositol monophosphatase family protein [Pseudolysinimonas sp.]|uniref:inositol monophosphatase family protein n=1 Tax=Pseudolysinimonas sp. TaxID=2680009 RepID=UPI0032637B33